MLVTTCSTVPRRCSLAAQSGSPRSPYCRRRWHADRLRSPLSMRAGYPLGASVDILIILPFAAVSSSSSFTRSRIGAIDAERSSCGQTDPCVPRNSRRATGPEDLRLHLRWRRGQRWWRSAQQAEPGCSGGLLRDGGQRESYGQKQRDEYAVFHFQHPPELGELGLHCARIRACYLILSASPALSR